MTGSGRAGGVTASSSRNWPHCAWRGSPSTTQASPSIRPRESGGTTRPRNVGNEYGGRSAPVQAAPPCRTSPMIRSSAIPAGLRIPPPSTGNSKRRRSIVVRRAQDDRLRFGSLSRLTLSHILVVVTQERAPIPRRQRLPLLSHVSKSAAGTNTIVRGSSGFTPTYTVSS